MTNSPIEEIKSRLDIVDVIGSYIELKKAGANYKALCPFHSENTPSFFVSPSRQIWHCFGCGEGHSIFDFVMKIEGVEFGDALRILAKRAGVELKHSDSRLQTKRKKLYEICELATKFFQAQLEKSSKGQKAKEYLLGRKISEDSIERWKLGWAPNSWQGLSDFLSTKGFGKGEIRRAGLTFKNKKGNYYDRFRGRIMFPVFDFNSQVIGFGGRVLKKKEGVAKYINTPNTLLYDKSRVLYGLDKAKVDIRKKDRCILVEGYVDVILSHQIEQKNMVAVSGTALTSHHLKILQRYSDNLLLGFDMDFAGDKATKRGIDLAQSQGFDLEIIKLPQGKDPADIISEDPEDFKERVKNAISIFDFYFRGAFRKFDKETPKGKKKIAATLLPKIKRIPNRIEQSHWIQELASRLGVREKYIEMEMKRIQDKSPADKPTAIEESKHPAVQKTRKDLIEERLMGLLFKKPEYLDFLDEEVTSHFSPRGKKLVEGVKEDKDLSDELKQFMDYLNLKVEVEDITEEEIEPEIKFCLKEIKSIIIKDKLNHISAKIRKAEQEEDNQQVKELTEQFAKWSKKITSI